MSLCDKKAPNRTKKILNLDHLMSAGSHSTLHEKELDRECESLDCLPNEINIDQCKKSYRSKSSYTIVYKIVDLSIVIQLCCTVEPLNVDMLWYPAYCPLYREFVLFQRLFCTGLVHNGTFGLSFV